MYRERCIANFWNKVDKSAGPNGCWLWTGAQDGHGYGHLTIDCKSKKSYRVAYEITKGPIPAGLDIDHMCHTKLCVNPQHLRAVTHKQNGENLNSASRNSKTGIRGVSWHIGTKKWRVAAMHHGRQYHGGLYDDIQEAEKAAIALRLDLFTHSDMDRAYIRRNTRKAA